jgi:hypothetical protein
MWEYSQSRLVQFVVVSLALAVVWTGSADARSWLQNPEFLIKGWGPPIWQGQRHHGSKSSRSTRARDSEVKRELERELHRMPPELPATGTVDAGANDAAQMWPQVLPAVEVAVRTRTSALRTDREVERELQRELRRMPKPPPMPPEALACAERLAKIAHYEPLPSRVGPGQCGADNLVRLRSIVMPDRTKVALNPPPEIGCGMAEELAQWVRDDLGPAAAELGAPLASIADNESYDCRGRNNVKGAMLSEHGKGNALDITGIKLRNGGMFNLTDRLVSKPFRERMRIAACGRFTTVLGPGSDSYHEEHIHLDLAERPHGYRLCQWDIREPGVAAKPLLPQAKPKAGVKGGTNLRARDANARALSRPRMKTAPNPVRRRHRSIY